MPCRKRPCRYCRHWFRPDPRVGDRQRACASVDCQRKRRAATQASWRRRNPEHQAQRRIDLAATATTRGEPARMPRPLDKLPWDWLKDEMDRQQAEFIQQFGRLLVRRSKDEMRAQFIDTT
jgi:hypothetical protein